MMRLRKAYVMGPEPREFRGKSCHGEATELYYDCAEAYSERRFSKRETTEFMASMRNAIEADPDFLDSYLMLAELHRSVGNMPESNALIVEAAHRALCEIEDEDGFLPTELDCRVMDNRPITRAIYQYVRVCWEGGRLDEALEILRYQLRAYPTDSLGCRYTILAILEGLSSDEFTARFQELVGFSSQWFQDGANRYPDDFDWWLKWTEDFENEGA